jgi:arylsulfatase A-like enzyme
LVNGDWKLTERERRRIRALYDAEVRPTDEALGSLLAALEAGGFRDDTWLVLTSDHGEMLGEYGRYLHGESLYPNEIRIPLLVNGCKRSAINLRRSRMEVIEASGSGSTRPEQPTPQTSPRHG